MRKVAVKHLIRGESHHQNPESTSGLNTKLLAALPSRVLSLTRIGLAHDQESDDVLQISSELVYKMTAIGIQNVTLSPSPSPFPSLVASYLPSHSDAPSCGRIPNYRCSIATAMLLRGPSCETFLAC